MATALDMVLHLDASLSTATYDQVTLGNSISQKLRFSFCNQWVKVLVHRKEFGICKGLAKWVMSLLWAHPQDTVRGLKA